MRINPVKRLILAFFLAFIPPLMASEEHHISPEAFIQELGDHVITLLTNKDMTTEERARNFAEIFHTKFNVKSIGKFVLGRYWKQATEDQKKRFLDLFSAVMVNTYATRFEGYTSQKFEVTGSRKEEDGGITVISEVLPADGQPIRVDWKLFEKNGELRIYDVLLDGISMSITQRSEYGAVIQQGGGDIESLLKALEGKVSTFGKPTL